MFKSLRIECFNFSYSDNDTILNGVYLQAQASEIIGILGRNGSGKTTLFNSLTVFGNYTGSVFINDVYASQKELSKKIAYLPQVSFIPKEKTVKYVIKMFPVGSSNKKEILKNQRIVPLLNQKVSELSGGEKRYFEFLLVNSLDRSIVILDEPFSEIEPIYEEIICNHIRSQQKNRLYIITDHKFSKIKEICTKLYLLSNSSLKNINDEKDLIKYGYLAKKS